LKALVNTEMNLQVPYNTGNLLSCWAIICFSCCVEALQLRLKWDIVTCAPSWAQPPNVYWIGSPCRKLLPSQENMGRSTRDAPHKTRSQRQRTS
jgi:hypothetical protein